MSMLNAKSKSDSAGVTRSFQSDSLVTGIIFMLGVNVGQRVIGFARSLFFCGFLNDDELGRWSLAFSFLLLAAPLVVLGIPGSFGRYVEHYRQRGQLRQFLWQTSIVTFGVATLAVGAMLCWPERFAWLVFKDTAQADLMRMLSLSLLAVIAFNYLTELLIALRQVRAATMMRFVHSLIFAGAGIGLLIATSLGEQTIVIAYGVGALVTVVYGFCVLISLWKTLPSSGTSLGFSTLWTKLLLFAGWVWFTNLVINLFDCADRFMIVHFAPDSGISAESLVGQYHCSRIVPVLLISVAGMLGGILLPYLSHDWEAGRRTTVIRHINLSIKLVGISYAGLGLTILLASPILFGWFLQGRYDLGLTVLPITLVYSIWFSLGSIANNYLWCAEKGKLVSLAPLVGLGTNIALNRVLLPAFGLPGAVAATAIATAVALSLTYVFSMRNGCRLDARVWFASGLPLVLCLGTSPATVFMITFAWLGWQRNWLFTQPEKGRIAEFLCSLGKRSGTSRFDFLRGAVHPTG